MHLQLIVLSKDAQARQNVTLFWLEEGTTKMTPPEKACFPSPAPPTPSQLPRNEKEEATTAGSGHSARFFTPSCSTHSYAGALVMF